MDARVRELALISLIACFCLGLAWAHEADLFAIIFAAAAAVAVEDGSGPVVEPGVEAPPTVTIHVPAEDLGTEGNGAAPAKKKTRRGSRGGKNRRKKPAGTAPPVSENGTEPEPATEPEPERPEEPEERDPNRYVPMSEWGDEFK